ncbi:delta-60 repeat domain-containing protein [Tahibacter harae]|uniref:Delta-60 repeat domain-containing protein n=1 Tax=Tahibacter harae TaxID=2963937 RepID=A0ABT1QW15_9GAMM|nr:delta-60 repeat domain-containing protein [Tahibacter harae]
MKHTNTPYGLHWCRKALAAAALLFVAPPLLAQWGPPGELDPSFAGTGKLTTDFYDRNDRINAIDTMSDGRFVVAGVVVGPNVGGGYSDNFALARYLPDGRLDGSFGNNGLVMFDVSGNVDEAHSVKVLRDGSILAAGVIAPGAYSDFVLFKRRRDGSADTSFGDDAPAGGRTGSVRLDVRGPSFHDEGRHFAVQSDGKIVMIGNTLVPNGNFNYRRVTAARFTADGRLDPGFGGSGTGYVVLGNQYANNGQTSDYVTGIALDQRGNLWSDDTINITGYTDSANNAFVVRLTRDGLLDTTFGTLNNGVRSGSLLLTATNSGGVASGISEVRAGRIDAAGRLVLVGPGTDRGLAFLRRQRNGDADMSFGSNGRTLVKLSDSSRYDEPAAMALQGNGKIVASGYATQIVGSTPQKDFFVVRLDANGLVDVPFGDQGRKAVTVSTTTDESTSMAVDVWGNLVVAGYALRAGTAQTDFAILRVYGDPDRIFADDYQVPAF